MAEVRGMLVGCSYMLIGEVFGVSIDRGPRMFLILAPRLRALLVFWSR